MSTIVVSYTSQHSPFTAHSVELKFFSGGEISRTYSGNSTFSLSANGSNVISGPAYRQKYIWGVSAVVTKAEALAFDAMFQDWDTDRAQGLPVVCGVVDGTFGATVNASAIYSTPPSFTKLGPNTYALDFGLSEI